MPKIKSPHIIVTEIEWDIDESDIEEYDCKPNLPNEVEIPMNIITDEISDDLLDTYAYAVKGFLIKKRT